MTVPADTAQIAARLTKARVDRTAIEPFSAEFAGFDIAAAYAVQRHLRAASGPLVGWKPGLTSRAKQAQVGVREPVRGFLAAANALDLGRPLQVSEHIQPRAEPEIVFIMGADPAALGHPASAVSWLVRSLAAEGEGLRAGDIVLSGGLTAAVPLAAGDVVTATADRLGSVEIGCE